MTRDEESIEVTKRDAYEQVQALLNLIYYYKNENVKNKL